MENSMAFKNETEVYLARINDWCALIEADPLSEDVIEFCFNILRDAGYYALTPGDAKENISKERIAKCFSTDAENKGHVDAPSFLNLTTLSVDADWYNQIWQKHRDYILDDPGLNNDPEVEEAWEAIYFDLKQWGVKLLTAGLDVWAVYSGRSFLFGQEIPSSNKAWEAAWASFEHKAESFLDTLLANKTIDFLPAAETLNNLINDFDEEQQQLEMPEKVRKFFPYLRTVTAPNKEFAVYQGYRMIISPEDAGEIFIRMEESNKVDGVSMTYRYDCALAEYALKHFIMRSCLSQNSSQDDISLPPISQWGLSSGIEPGNYSIHPAIFAGDKRYVVCTAPSGVKKFSVRKDLITKLGTHNGVLFASYKNYPSNEILIRFDNFIEKDRINGLLESTPAVEGTEGKVIGIPFEELYREKKRATFLQEAAQAVLGLGQATEKNTASDTVGQLIEGIFVIFGAPERVLTAIVNLLEKIGKSLPFEPLLNTITAEAVMSDESNYYVPMKQLSRDTSFLDPEDPNAPESVLDLINRAYKEEWYSIYRFVDLESSALGDWLGPEKVTGAGLILEIPEGTNSVWFLIGSRETLERVKVDENRQDDKLYMIIYGPSD